MISLEHGMNKNVFLFERICTKCENNDKLITFIGLKILL